MTFLREEGLAGYILQNRERDRTIPQRYFVVSHA